MPQLMSKNADEFVWAAQVLADMGYREVNLNLGCPSGTVVAKGKARVSCVISTSSRYS